MARWVPAWRREARRQESGLREVAAEVASLLGGTAAWGGPGSWANQAVAVGMDGPADEAGLDALVAFYADRGVDARVEVVPFVDPSLVRGLADRGFVLERFEHVWLRELPAGEDLRARLPHGWPEGVEVRAVRPGEEELFVEVSSSGFRDPGVPLGEADRAIGLRMVRSPDVVSLLAFVDGRAVGGASGGGRDGAAGLFGASVLPAFRGRGIQSALLVARLEALRSRDIEVVCVESTPGVATERNARRLGFELAGTKVLLRRPSRGTAAGG